MGSKHGEKCQYFWNWYELILHIHNKNKDILILGEEPTQRLDNTPLTAEARNHINFTWSQKKIFTL